MSGMKDEELKRIDKEHVWHPFTQMRDYVAEDNIMIERGEGAYLIDTAGRRYLDGVSSMWTNLFGHRKREIDDALRAQLDRIAHSTLLGIANVPSTILAKRLAGIAPAGLNKVFYSDNGSTAVEVALKMAFMYHRHKGDHGRTKFISFKNAYHGDTIGAMSAGGIPLFHGAFEPLMMDVIHAPSPYCYRCEFGLSSGECGDKYCNKYCKKCLEALEGIASEYSREAAALIIEPIVQCAGGMIMAPAGFLKGVREICTRYGILMIADEVAVGFGRTGTMFGCENEQVSPDIMAIAKGLTAGYLPFAATLATDKIYEAFLGGYSEFKTLFHGHTFTGNQLGASVALAVLDIFERENTLRELKPKIECLSGLLERFNDHPNVGEVRQRGFIAAIELVRDKGTKEEFPPGEKIGIRVIKRAAALGLIIRPLGNIIVIMPPYVITARELNDMVNTIEESINHVLG